MALKNLSQGMSILARIMGLGLAGLSLGLLGGCLFVTDTSRMNTEVFAAETAPVWDRPAVERPLPQKPAGLGNLYQNQFHQTYGMTTSPAPVSSMSTQ